MSYYNLNAQEFFDGTVNVDMTSVYNEFIPLLKRRSLILDAGCGAGRDSKAFKDLGFRVHAIDASPKLAELAEQQINQPVEVITFKEFEPTELFDAVWACASLLHVPMVELSFVFKHLADSLKNKGVFYCSFKYGDNEIERDGRKFTNLNKTLLKQVISGVSLKVFKVWYTSDLRKGRKEQQWLNVILIKE